MNEYNYLETCVVAQNTRVFKAGGTREITTIYFGGGPPDKYFISGQIHPPTWQTGQPLLEADVIFLRPYPGRLRRREHHLAGRLRADHVQLARQPQQALTGEGEQDLLSAARDRQAPGVEEVVHWLVLDDACAIGQLHPELRQRLPVPHANQLACAGFCARVLTAERQLGDALDQQRADLSRSISSPILLRRVEFEVVTWRSSSSIGLPSAVPCHRDPLIGQRGAGQPPPVVDLADDHLVGHEHVVEEHLVEQIAPVISRSGGCRCPAFSCRQGSR